MYILPLTLSVSTPSADRVRGCTPQALIFNNNAMSEEMPANRVSTDKWSYNKAVNETADKLRVEIKEVARRVKALSMSLKAAPRSESEEQRELDGEVIADCILSYRHLEDASMRIGKMKQYLNDGESVYDKNVVGSK